MKVAIHQPNYLPYLGFFEKTKQADVLVLLNTVQYPNGSVTNRMKIKTKESTMWLTIPIEKKHYSKPITEIPLPENDNKWQKKHKYALIANYGRCTYFDRPFIDQYYSTPYKSLEEFNEAGIEYLIDKLKLKIEIVKANALRIDKSFKATDLLINIIKKIGGDTYISGAGGKKYIEEKKFEANNINVEYALFTPEAYPQRWYGFVPYLSAIDYVFNVST